MRTRKNDVIFRGQTPDARHATDVVVNQGKVIRVKRAGLSPADFGDHDAWLIPTLFDIQVNGAGGVNLQGDHLTIEDVERIGAYLARCGVSCWVPTLVTASLDEMEHGCRVITEAMDRPSLRRAIPGLHLEGPVISPVDGARGAHPKAHVRPPDLRDFDRLSKAARGRVLYTTVAPDGPGAAAYIRGVVKRGTAVSLGHHLANREQIHAAVEAGATLCTHLGNGAPAMIHRHHNMIWPQLAEDRLHASLIADLHHLPVDTMKCFVRGKGAERIVLTSDAVDLAGMPPGQYEFGGAKVELRKDGKICLLGTDLLAGSSLMLIQGVVNVWRHGVMSLAEAAASASSVPAKLFGLRCKFRLPRVGDKADFVLFNLTQKAKQPPQAVIQAVCIEGKLQ